MKAGISPTADLRGVLKGLLADQFNLSEDSRRGDFPKQRRDPPAKD